MFATKALNGRTYLVDKAGSVKFPKRENETMF